jgi:signal transduction histidine kinase
MVPNLIDNVLDAIPESGTITVSVRAELDRTVRPHRRRWLGYSGAHAGAYL